MKQATNRKQQARPLAELYRELGAALAAIFEHPDVPASVHDLLGDFTCEAGNKAAFLDTARREAAYSRAMLPAYLDIMTAAAGKERAR
jgi:hypothetical protein